MAVPNIPFYLSQANTEFPGNGRASQIMSNAGLGATGLVSRLAGKSNIVFVKGPPTLIRTSAQWRAALGFIRRKTACRHEYSLGGGGSWEETCVTASESTPVYFRVTLVSGTGYDFVNLTNGAWTAFSGTYRNVGTKTANSQFVVNVRYSTTMSDDGLLYNGNVTIQNY